MKKETARRLRLVCFAAAWLLMLAYPIWGVLTAMRGETRPFPVIGRFQLLR